MNITLSEITPLTRLMEASASIPFAEGIAAKYQSSINLRRFDELEFLNTSKNSVVPQAPNVNVTITVRQNFNRDAIYKHFLLKPGANSAASSKLAAVARNILRFAGDVYGSKQSFSSSAGAGEYLKIFASPLFENVVRNLVRKESVYTYFALKPPLRLIFTPGVQNFATPEAAGGTFSKMPDWAGSFLKNSFQTVAGTAVNSDTQFTANKTPQSVWTAPKTALTATKAVQPVDMRLKSDDSAKPQAFTQRDVNKLADKVYKVIENRLITERRRLGL
ncbi:MAG: hypothetical protein LBM98_09020 [Oscillospiraceae bacterium]|jgi:hypothetical protein|nr:hypothetical protein [Oscillospiraceae bacterium]